MMMILRLSLANSQTIESIKNAIQEELTQQIEIACLKILNVTSLKTRKSSRITSVGIVKEAIVRLFLA